MSSSQWHYTQNGLAGGPVSSGRLKQLATSGKLLPSDLIWKEGMPEWRPACDFVRLFDQVESPAPGSQRSNVAQAAVEGATRKSVGDTLRGIRKGRAALVMTLAIAVAWCAVAGSAWSDLASSEDPLTEALQVKTEADRRLSIYDQAVSKSRLECDRLLVQRDRKRRESSIPLEAYEEAKSNFEIVEQAKSKALEVLSKLTDRHSFLLLEHHHAALALAKWAVQEKANCEQLSEHAIQLSNRFMFTRTSADKRAANDAVTEGIERSTQFLNELEHMKGEIEAKYVAPIREYEQLISRGQAVYDEAARVCTVAKTALAQAKGQLDLVMGNAEAEYGSAMQSLDAAIQSVAAGKESVAKADGSYASSLEHQQTAAAHFRAQNLWGIGASVLAAAIALLGYLGIANVYRRILSG